MSSPMMTRMFGFFPEDGVGDCALADTVRMHISARLNALRMIFIFIRLVCLVLGVIGRRMSS